MNILKLTGGIILIIMGGILAVISLIQLTKIPRDFSDAYHIGKFFGGMIVILVVVSIFMIRYGGRLTSKRN